MHRKRIRPSKADLDKPVSIDLHGKAPEEALRDLLAVKVERDEADEASLRLFVGVLAR
jgi:hypothetical protein